jgi:hypothetical protein
MYGATRRFRFTLVLFLKLRLAIVMGLHRVVTVPARVTPRNILAERSHTTCFIRYPKLKRLDRSNHLIFPFEIYVCAPPEFSVTRAKLPHGVSYVSPLLPALFLPRAPRLQVATSREIAHMQAGQCDNQMGTKFK